MKHFALADFFLVRDSFLKHIRSFTRKLQWDMRVQYVEDNRQTIFSNFEFNDHLSETGRDLLVKIATDELKRMKKSADAWIASEQEQIDLTQRSSLSNEQKNKDIASHLANIDHTKFKYHAKFPSTNQIIMPAYCFEGAPPVFTCFADPTSEYSDVTMTLYVDTWFVTLNAEPKAAKKKDIISITDVRYRR
jgi:hypothetical protein